MALYIGAMVKTFICKSLFLLVAIFLLAVKLQGQNEVVKDSLSVPVEILTTRSYDNGVISIGRSQFLSFPASFDDPTRLLLKYPGISTANDQANSVIYHGLPSHMHQWQLYGARILNPNHLSNAGTLSDNPSSSSGGVNMMSGQVIGEMNFYGNPSENSLNAIAGNSDIKLRNPYQNNLNLNLSLIGMEAGLDRILGKQQNQNLMLNYRYSTVGLLTDFGLDFGGEVIKYQDATAKYSIKTKKAGTFDIYAIYGTSSNDKKAVTPVTEIKDSQEIDYFKDNVIVGASHKMELNNSLGLKNTLNYSNVQEGSNSYLIDSNAVVNNERAYSEIEEELLSFSSKLTKKYKNSSLSTFASINYMRQFFDVGIFEENNNLWIASSFYSKKRTETLAVIEYESKGHKINYKLNIGGLYNSVNGFYPTGAIGLSANNTIGKIQFSYALAAQEPNPYINSLYSIGNEDSRHTQSHSLRLQQSYKSFSTAIFYHRLFNLVYADANGFTSSLDEVGLVSDFDFDLKFTTADVYGIDLNYTTRVAGIDVFSTLTLMNGKQKLNEKSENIPYNYGHIANLRLSKKWQLTKKGYLGLGLSFHHRGGAYQSVVDTENSIDIGHTAYLSQDPYSVRLANYWRADMRVYYAVKRGKYKSTVSLDIQNVTNRENDAFFYYEPLDSAARLRKQLGLLPVLSWRVSI